MGMLGGTSFFHAKKLVISCIFSFDFPWLNWWGRGKVKKQGVLLGMSWSNYLHFVYKAKTYENFMCMKKYDVDMSPWTSACQSVVMNFLAYWCVCRLQSLVHGHFLEWPVFCENVFYNFFCDNNVKKVYNQ